MLRDAQREEKEKRKEEEEQGKKEMVKKWFKPETKQRRVTKSMLDNDDGSDKHQQN